MEMDRMSRDLSEARRMAVEDRTGGVSAVGGSSRLGAGLDDGRVGSSRLGGGLDDRGGGGAGGGRMGDLVGRSRSPVPDYSTRSAVEIVELQDKLEKTNNELRRAQAELRLNQSDYDRSHVELEQMQEKVRNY